MDGDFFSVHSTGKWHPPENVKLIPYNNNKSQAIKRVLWRSWHLYFIAFEMIPMCLIVPWPQNSHR